jgi:hypothetical protein
MLDHVKRYVILVDVMFSIVLWSARASGRKSGLHTLDLRLPLGDLQVALPRLLRATQDLLL